MCVCRSVCGRDSVCECRSVSGGGGVCEGRSVCGGSSGSYRLKVKGVCVVVVVEEAGRYSLA